jgi:hypothetical protein
VQEGGYSKRLKKLHAKYSTMACPPYFDTVTRTGHNEL